MFSRAYSTRDVFAEMNRLQQELQQYLDHTPSIRGLSQSFPAINAGSTEQSVDIYAFVPGVDPASLDVQIEKGVLTIAGERKAENVPEKATLHVDERFAGRFRRVVTLPDDVESTTAQARYSDGVLHISLPRKEAVQPRRIAIQ